MKISPNAGKPADNSILVDLPKLITAYYEYQPDPTAAGERVIFGTSGHRGSSFDRAFNQNHIIAITEAICLYRKEQGITGPLFIGIDTHALSRPAYTTALEVLAAHDIDVMIAEADDYTPTPVISHAILTYNQWRKGGLADGIVITPSHNPPEDGGFKYNPPQGGPAENSITAWIQEKANAILASGVDEVRRVPYAKALELPTTHKYNYKTPYIDDLASIIDMDIIRASGLKLGVDPLGGAGVDYWGRIAERFRLDLTVVSAATDPTFRFMTVDWDGRIRMDPSSPYAMQRLIALKDRFDVAFACDPDHDRHGIVTKSAGLLAPNHYLAVCIQYLFSNRPQWGAEVAVGKTVVSSSIIDRVTAQLKRSLYEVPVGFKYFVDGLFGGTLGFAGEESAGSSFLRRDGRVWTTDKDGLIAALLSAEITAKTGKDPGALYTEVTDALGLPYYARTEAPANAQQKKILSSLGPENIKAEGLAGEPITQTITTAPGDGNKIGGVKVSTKSGWFAARPSGTEDVYKIYAESFVGQAHLDQITSEAQTIVDAALSGASG